jgi:hypothetical protein
MEKDYKVIIGLVIVIILIALAICSLKLRETSDKVDKLADLIITEQALEQPTTQDTTEVKEEPSDDEIVIEIRKEYREGGENE